MMCDFEITGIEGLRAEGVAHCTDCGPGRCDCDSGFYIYKYIYKYKCFGSCCVVLYDRVDFKSSSTTAAQMQQIQRYRMISAP